MTTDVSYILFWVSTSCRCYAENRYREIIDQAQKGPADLHPNGDEPALLHLINDVAAITSYDWYRLGKIYIHLNVRRWCIWSPITIPCPSWGLSSTRSAPIRKVSNTLSCRITAKRRTSKNSHIWEAITPPPSAVSSETYTACPSTNGCWRKNGKASSKTYSTLICGLQRFATGMVSTRCPTLHTSAKTPSETPARLAQESGQWRKNRKDHRLRNYFFNSLVNQSISPIFAVCKRCKTSKF